MQPKEIFSLHGKTIWVAGETGMVGQSIVRRVQDEECTILSAPHADLDLTCQAKTYEWLADNKPDVVILAAAKVGGIGANAAEPAIFLYDNLAIAQNVIHGSYKTGVEKLVYLGSSCIYPKFSKQPIKEEAILTGALEPTNEAYAIAKIAGLKLCQFYRQQYGCGYISVMPTNLYGVGDRFDRNTSHVIPSLILKIHDAKIEGKKEVVLWGTGSPLREFLYVDDLSDAIIHVLKYYSDTSPINIGSGVEISIHDLANVIAEVIGYQGNIKFAPQYPDGTPRKLLDCSRLHAMKWQARTMLKQGLQETYRWFLDHC